MGDESRDISHCYREGPCADCLVALWPVWGALSSLLPPERRPPCPPWPLSGVSALSLPAQLLLPESGSHGPCPHNTFRPTPKFKGSPGSTYQAPALTSERVSDGPASPGSGGGILLSCSCACIRTLTAAPLTTLLGWSRPTDLPEASAQTATRQGAGRTQWGLVHRGTMQVPGSPPSCPRIPTLTFCRSSVWANGRSTARWVPAMLAILWRSEGSGAFSPHCFGAKILVTRRWKKQQDVREGGGGEPCPAIALASLGWALPSEFTQITHYSFFLEID